MQEGKEGGSGWPKLTTKRKGSGTKGTFLLCNECMSDFYSANISQLSFIHVSIFV